MNDTNPLSVILVKNGSKGDRLLFRYPFVETRPESSIKMDSEPDEQWDSPLLHESSRASADARRNPYALTMTEDDALQRASASSNISNGQLVGFPDKLLSNLFAMKNQLCGQKFELKVNDVRFVGHPMLLQQAGMPLMSPIRQASTIILFNVVFALRAYASHYIVRCYHDLSQRLGIALRHEERRVGYLSKEAKLMLTAHDQVSTLPEDKKETPFNLILQTSQLARDLRKIYDDLCSTGVISLKINRWIEVSFCLPQHVYRTHKERIIEPEALQRCLDSLKPYHAMLLLVNQQDLLNSFPVDASPALVRLIYMWNPLKSLSHLALDADLTLTQVFQLVGHLVYWAQATIIYPMCESNVYMLSPHAPTSISSALVDKFKETFPKLSLLKLMSEFSLPNSISQIIDPTELLQYQRELICATVWMLQHNLLIQLHTYVCLIPTLNGCNMLLDDSHPSSPRSVYSGRIHRCSASDSDMGSVASDDLSPSPNGRDRYPSVTADDATAHKRLQDGPPSELHVSTAEKEIIMQVPAASNPEDLRLFLRLCQHRYFNGQHHLESIMYCENMTRFQLLTLFDKFRNVLITSQHEDDAVAVFYRRLHT